MDALAQLVDEIEFDVGHVAQIIELADQGGLDRRVLPHQKQDRRAHALEDVIAQLEGAALAHADPDIDERIGEFVRLVNFDIDLV